MTEPQSDSEPLAWRRDLGDDRSIWLRPQLFNWLLMIGSTDAEWFTDSWEYADVGAAIVAYVSWQPAMEQEPSGWIRNPRSGRRRPDGDPAREYIAE